MTNNQYPVFEANQVLTHTQLNELFGYQDEQLRLTRAHLLGSGVQCGLEVSLVTGGNQVNISAGNGIGSQGYLLDFADTQVFDSFKNYPLPETIAYPHFLKTLAPVTTYNFIELCPPGTPGTTSLASRPANFYTDKVVILFLELKQESVRNCTPNNCDDKGTEVNLRLRVLLVNKTEADSIIAKTSPSSTEISNKLATIAALQIGPMPRWIPKTQNLATTNDVLSQLQSFFQANSFPNAMANQIDSLSNACQFLIPTLNMSTTTNQLRSFASLITTAAKIPFLQNFLDFYYDLSLACQDAYQLATQILCACDTNDDSYPRHLMLGILQPTNPATQELYRHKFISSAMISQCDKKLKELQQCFTRITLMIQSFSITPSLHAINQLQSSGVDPEIRLTPSSTVTASQLKDSAIPYYYQGNTTALKQAWNFQKQLLNKSSENLSYRSYEFSPSAPTHIQSPLKFESLQQRWLRTEGHLGKNISTVYNTLQAYCKEYNLAVDVITLETGLGKSSGFNYKDRLSHFVAKHQGIQHTPGVAQGGTLVLVGRGESDQTAIVNNAVIANHSVIADFYLPYRVSTNDFGGYKPIRECEFEWIDSAKHRAQLLTRDYGLNRNKPPKTLPAKESDASILHANYVVRVYAYSIQGVSLLPSTKDISISLSELKTKGLNAIATALNKAFPLGLVFEHKAKSNKLVIRYVDGQSFRIELGGVQGNQIRYAYTEKAIYNFYAGAWHDLSHNATYQLSCRMVSGPYEESDYEFIHNQFPAVEKAITELPSAKDVIQWQKIIKARAAQYQQTPPTPIQWILNNLVSQILSIDSDAKITLIGPWANGSWAVNNEKVMIESVKKAKTSLAEFSRLRKTVTNKTGASSIDLLVDSDTDISADMLVVWGGFTITLMKGKRDMQKGIPLEGSTQNFALMAKDSTARDGITGEIIRGFIKNEPQK